jgi:hypothetical protein
MSSLRKKDANKGNAGKSTGPTTERGKRNSSSNSLKHGFYSRELRVSDSDKPEFEILRKKLLAQLAPGSPLQDIAADQIVASCWRNKMAMRLEMHQLKGHFPADESTSDKTDSQRDARETQWYGASREDLRNGIRILTELRDDVSQHGLVHAETWKFQISKCFGVGFYDALTEWKGMSIDAILSAEHLVRHAEAFKRPLPDLPPEVTPAVEKIDRHVVADPKLQMQMVVKLVELQSQHLLDLLFISSHASATRETAANEFAPRYFANSSRDLQRAVEWYLHLRANNL